MYALLPQAQPQLCTLVGMNDEGTVVSEIEILIGQERAHFEYGDEALK